LAAFFRFIRAVRPLFRSAGNLKQMVAELGLYRSKNLPDLAAEHDLIKFFNHLPRAKLTQRAPLIP